MKALVTCLMLMSFGTFAAIDLNVEIEEQIGDQSIILEDDLKAEFGKKIVIKDENLQREVELILSNKFPKGLQIKDKKDAVVVKAKFFDIKNGKRKFINNYMIVGKKGERATMHMGKVNPTEKDKKFTLRVLAK